MQVINTNISSLNSQRHLNNTQSALSTSLERLSSGKRINSAKDDAAGLGISDRMTAQINGMNQAIRNARDGISMSQTAEGALSTSRDMLQRIRTLAVQSSNATNASVDRQALQDEVNELTAELNRIAQTTTFNGQKLLDGTLGGQNFQVGANAGELITANGTNFQTSVYGGNRIYSKAANVAAKGTLTDAKVTISGNLGTSKELDFSAAKSAKAAAVLVNAESGKTGVTATARTEALFTAKENVSYSLQIKSNNSEEITLSFTIGEKLDADGYAEAINAFNSASAKTGVTAEYSADLGGIKLTNAAGETISLGRVKDTGDANAKLANLQYDSATDIATAGTAVAVAEVDPATAGDFADKAVAAVGTVTFDSQAGFSISAAGTTDFAATANSSKLKSVASLDVSTFDKAQLAIAICDAAINTIDKEMSRYGALQSRFDSTIKNLEVNAENTSNARSRIQDADYASETAELSRASILQQAGTAMLAQANQMPQTVLSLIG